MATSDAPGRGARNPRSPQAGFTLAGLIVVLTIILIFIAYTVPTQWSKVMQREREKQTIFAMKQYARAIREWTKVHGANPVKLDQLKEQKMPRVLRGPKGEYPDPLTGKMDWILIPPGAVTSGPVTPGAVAGGMPGSTTSTAAPPFGGNTSTTGTTTGTTTSTTGTTTSGPSSSGGKTTFNAAASPKDYVGPFIGVRPAATGRAILSLNGSDDYGQWYYTITDLDLEIKANTLPNPNAH